MACKTCPTSVEPAPDSVQEHGNPQCRQADVRDWLTCGNPASSLGSKHVLYKRQASQTTHKSIPAFFLQNLKAITKEDLRDVRACRKGP
eukprot:1161311-Pelagomonas_calceolata.AAC.5